MNDKCTSLWSKREKSMPLGYLKGIDQLNYNITERKKITMQCVWFVHANTKMLIGIHPLEYIFGHEF